MANASKMDTSGSVKDVPLSCVIEIFYQYRVILLLNLNLMLR